LRSTMRRATSSGAAADPARPIAIANPDLTRNPSARASVTRLPIVENDAGASVVGPKWRGSRSKHLERQPIAVYLDDHEMMRVVGDCRTWPGKMLDRRFH